MSKSYLKVISALAITIGAVEHVRQLQEDEGTVSFCKSIIEKCVDACDKWPANENRAKVFRQVHSIMADWQKAQFGDGKVNIAMLLASIIGLLSDLSVRLGSSPRRKVIDSVTDDVTVLFEAYEKLADVLAIPLEEQMVHSLDVAATYDKAFE